MRLQRVTLALKVCSCYLAEPHRPGEFPPRGRDLKSRGLQVQSPPGAVGMARNPCLRWSRSITIGTDRSSCPATGTKDLLRGVLLVSLIWGTGWTPDVRCVSSPVRRSCSGPRRWPGRSVGFRTPSTPACFSTWAAGPSSREVSAAFRDGLAADRAPAERELAGSEDIFVTMIPGSSTWDATSCTGHDSSVHRGAGTRARTRSYCATVCRSPGRPRASDRPARRRAARTVPSRGGVERSGQPQAAHGRGCLWLRRASPPWPPKRHSSTTSAVPQPRRTSRVPGQTARVAARSCAGRRVRCERRGACWKGPQQGIRGRRVWRRQT